MHDDLGALYGRGRLHTPKSFAPSTVGGRLLLIESAHARRAPRQAEGAARELSFNQPAAQRAAKVLSPLGPPAIGARPLTFSFLVGRDKPN